MARAYRTYHYLGKRIARARAVDEDGVCYPGVYFHDPDREANAMAQANGFRDASAHRASRLNAKADANARRDAARLLQTDGLRKPPQEGKYYD